MMRSFSGFKLESRASALRETTWIGTEVQGLKKDFTALIGVHSIVRQYFLL